MPNEQIPKEPWKFKHGHTANNKVTLAYSSWKHAKRRCFNPNDLNYPNYGGRGVTMCKGWKDSFPNFYETMGDRPPRMTLDRIDNKEGHYSCGECEECIENKWPLNCKWSTKKEQDRNRRTNKVYTVQGVTGCVIELCEHFEIDVRLFYNRRKQDGWSVEKSLTEPIREAEQITVAGVTGSLRALSIHFGIPENRAFRRIHQLKWGYEKAFLTPVRQGNYRTGA